jgi:UDP-N-acetyl-D-mannosaminuronate dehydrogenase
MTKHLVAGLGEIGQAIYNLLSTSIARDVIGFDVETQADTLDTTEERSVERLHVCFPYTDQFDINVQMFSPILAEKCIIVIHSTVPLGTTDAIGQMMACDAVHSPVRGKHPKLLASLMKFPKWCGGRQAVTIAHEFAECGCEVRPVEDARNTEAMKLWDTTQYAWNVLMEKVIHRYCQNHGLSMDVVYRTPNAEYNHGYRELNSPHFCRYVLSHMPGPVGGHCLMPNLELLAQSCVGPDHDAVDFLEDMLEDLGQLELDDNGEA